MSIGKPHKTRWLFIETCEKFEGSFRPQPRIYNGAEFSKIINKAKITGSSNTTYQILAKTFEVPASRSLLFINEEYGDGVYNNPKIILKRLGFIENRHYVFYDRNNIEDKINYYLKHDNERQRITDNGWKMVHKKHTIQQRAREWWKYIEDVYEEKNAYTVL